ncbi:hypothetical protein RI367_008127 [Sorochytrium milnesiophthora]
MSRLVDYFFIAGLDEQVNLSAQPPNRASVTLPALFSSTPTTDLHPKSHGVEAIPFPGTFPPSRPASMALSIMGLDGGAGVKSPNEIIEESVIVPSAIDYGSQTVNRRRSVTAPADDDILTSGIREPHPIINVFEPDLLCRYPAQDWDGTPFPTRCIDYSFPHQLQLAHPTITKVHTECHTWVATDNQGSQMYGVTAIVYEPLQGKQLLQFKESCDVWTRINISPKTMQAYKYLRLQLEKERRILALAEKDPRTASRLQVSKRMVEEFISEVKHNIDILEQLTNKLSAVDITAETTRVPKAIGLVSRYPIFDLLKDWLSCMLVAVTREGNYAPMESFVCNIVHEAPLPAPGIMELALDAECTRLYFRQASPSEYPELKNVSLFPLCRALDRVQLVSLVESALSEKKIIFISEHLSMLNYALQGLLHLIFPFKWKHIMIPVLPNSALSILQQDMPFIVGIRRTFERMDYLPPDAVVVNLDRNEVLAQVAGLPVRFPPALRNRLIENLGKYVHPVLSGRGIPRYMKQMFPHGRSFLQSVDSRRASKTAISPYGLKYMPELDEDAEYFNQLTAQIFGDGTALAVTGSISRRKFSDMKILSQLPSTLHNLTTFEGHEFKPMDPEQVANASCMVCMSAKSAESILRCSDCSYMSHSDCAGLICKPCAGKFNENSVQREFLKVYAALFRGYYNFISPRRPVDLDPNMPATFRDDEFLAYANKPYLEWIEPFLSTSVFRSFIQDTTALDPTVVYFDKFVKDAASIMSKMQKRLGRDQKSFTDTEAFNAPPLRHSSYNPALLQMPVGLPPVPRHSRSGSYAASQSLHAPSPVHTPAPMPAPRSRQSTHSLASVAQSAIGSAIPMPMPSAFLDNQQSHPPVPAHTHQQHYHSQQHQPAASAGISSVDMRRSLAGLERVVWDVYNQNNEAYSVAAATQFHTVPHDVQEKRHVQAQALRYKIQEMCRELTAALSVIGRFEGRTFQQGLEQLIKCKESIEKLQAVDYLLDSKERDRLENLQKSVISFITDMLRDLRQKGDLTPVEYEELQRVVASREEFGGSFLRSFGDTAVDMKLWDLVSDTR